MALKRKRSSQIFSSPFSDTAPTDTPSPAIPCFYNHSKPTSAEPLHKKPTWSFPTYDDDHLSAKHLDSRTRKRHRDDRPDEQTVHGASCWLGTVMQMSSLANVCRCAASTITKLYEAQRRHPDAAPVPSQPSQSVSGPSDRSQRSTLHSFWQISQPPPASTTMAIDAKCAGIGTLQMRCEDCDRSSADEDAMDLDESGFGQDTACHFCKRQVCDTCAVLGNDRVCLGCANGSGR